jgi:thiol-disulfide isomerase/thioredoxin
LTKHSTARTIGGTWWAAAAVCTLVMAASGCRDREVASTVSTTHASPAPAESTHATPPQEIRRVTARQIRELVDERKGKVVVVNFWASWCPPCVREFPAITKVYQQYHDKGLDLFAVALNAPEEIEEIKQFLAEQKPPFSIYLADPEDKTFNETVLEKWYGEMPLTLVFNTAGERVLAHRSEVTYEALSKTLEPLLPHQ